jgi:proteasome lid subunit RPN8/RPN11
LNADTLAAISTHALADYPRESCGLVIVRKGRERYVPCRNTSTTPSEHFRLRADDFAAAEDQGEVIALVHSHPDTNAEPSDADRVACEASELPWHIVSVIRDGGDPVVRDVRTVTPCGYEAPLVGREFAHGILDCYTLVQDWYARERGVELPYFERHDGWWDIEGEDQPDLYMKHFAEAGFQIVAAHPQDEGFVFQEGDIVLMQHRATVANHAAVYVGDGKMLHHLHGRLSSLDIYGGMWAEITRAIVRRKELCNA